MKPLILSVILLVFIVVSTQATTIEWKQFENNISADGAWLTIKQEHADMYILLSSVSSVMYDKDSKVVELKWGSSRSESIGVYLGNLNRSIRLQRILDVIANANQLGK